MLIQDTEYHVFVEVFWVLERAKRTNNAKRLASEV